MSGELEIRGGGAVAVDTATLREAAARFVRARSELDEITLRASTLMMRLFDERAHAQGAYSACSVLVQTALYVGVDAERISDELQAAAAVYEMVELDAQRQAAQAAGDEAAVRRIEAMRTALQKEHPDAVGAAQLLEFQRTVMWPSELAKQSAWLGIDAGSRFGLPGAVIGGTVLGGLTIGGAILVGGAGWGRLSRDARLKGGPAAVRLVPVGVAGRSAAAPSSLADAASRIPSGTAARVRVERYTMPDGSKEFEVYVGGTANWTPGTDEAWDITSNGELGLGKVSASFTATTMALEAAGAAPGDTVHAFGFSQGATIAAHLALEGDYDVQTLVSLGSPVAADVDSGTLNVSLRHTDDPVTALAGGGFGNAVGAPGSFVAETVADQDGVWTDAGRAPHSLDSYVRTASLVDESGDPRVTRVGAVFDRLGGAVAVEVFEYGAERAGAGR